MTPSRSSVPRAVPRQLRAPRAQRGAAAGGEGVWRVFLGCEAAWHARQPLLTLFSSGGTLPSQGLADTGKEWKKGPLLSFSRALRSDG